jgi:NAD+ kinase
LGTLQNIGVLAHPHRPSTAPLAERVAQSLQARGIDSWVRTAWNAVNAQPLVEHSDLVIAIGGDGSMLRTARVCAPYGVPILGINMGHLGFLTEIIPEVWEMAIDRLIDGDYWLEERMMIQCEVWHQDECVTTEDALNDVVISRGAVAKSVHLESYINDHWTTTYNADGLIIATPTGSTAYALAVGGPILPPELKNILMIPVAPHLSMDRPLVLAQESVVKVIVAPRSFEPEVVVTVDGELVGSMNTHDYITVRASDQSSLFVRLRESNYFFRSILDRLEPRLAMRHSPSNHQEAPREVQESAADKE